LFLAIFVIRGLASCLLLFAGMTDPSSDDYVADLERICADDHARRELLYLRALEKDDLDAARDLEEVDPDLRTRLTHAGVDLSLPKYEPDGDRRARFARSYDETSQRHALRLRRDC
jgi:hypothetical protein